MDKFAERLKQLRNDRKMTQVEICKQFEIQERSYQNYEIGKSKPTYATLIKIADFHDVPLDYLVGRSDDPKRR